MKQLTSLQLYNSLLAHNILTSSGQIIFTLGGTSVTINKTDIVGNSIQSWLKKWMDENDIFNEEPTNTQEFPDFYLSNKKTEGFLEVKAFNFNAAPAFDIANFESYCDSMTQKACRLDADYLIFGYTMDKDGTISIKRIWLKKIWEIAGSSRRYALNTQIKRNVIYNIRPSGNFKKDKPSVFTTKEDFLTALYSTLSAYRGEDIAINWKKQVIDNYKNYTNETLIF